MSLGVAELLIALLFLIVPFVLMIWALVDLFGHDSSAWKQIGQIRLLWAAFVFFVGFVGPVVYLLAMRPKLRDASAH